MVDDSGDSRAGVTGTIRMGEPTRCSVSFRQGPASWLHARLPKNSRSFRKIDDLKMVAELRQEREKIEEAIITLERLSRGRGRRRGRPPAWMTATKEAWPSAGQQE